MLVGLAENLLDSWVFGSLILVTVRVRLSVDGKESSYVVQRRLGRIPEAFLAACGSTLRVYSAKDSPVPVHFSLPGRQGLQTIP